MSQENVELVRTGWSLWDAGDVAALFEIWDPEIVWDTTRFRDWPETVYEGHDGVGRFLTEWLDVWGTTKLALMNFSSHPTGAW